VPPGKLESETFHLATRLAKVQLLLTVISSAISTRRNDDTRNKSLSSKLHHMLRCSETEDARELFNATREGASRCIADIEATYVAFRESAARPRPYVGAAGDDTVGGVG